MLTEVTDTLLAFERHDGDRTLLCVFNMGAEPIDWSRADAGDWRVLESINDATTGRLGGYAALIAERTGS